MRALPSWCIARALLLAWAPTVVGATVTHATALADGARDLGRPYDAPELDIEPRGLAHFVIGMSGAWLGSTEHFDDSWGGTLVLGADVCLIPSGTVALHLRGGALAAVRTETRRTEPDGALRSAALSVRGWLLAGLHIVRLVAIRAGFELGEGHSFIIGTGSGGTLGFAFLGQLGVRLGEGRLELGVEIAADLREGSVISSAPVRSVQETAPRLALYFTLTL